MPEPGGDPIACIGCGAMNPPGSEACAGCGHRFSDPGAGPSAVPAPAATDPDPVPVPAAAAPPPTAKRESSGRTVLIVASLIALGAGLLLFSMPLGVMFLAAAGLATARTSVAGSRRRRAGRPLGRDEAVLVFAKSLGGAFLVMVSAAIAFVVTCFPIGLFTGGNGPEDQLGGSLVIAFVVGGVSAAVAGGFVTHQLLKKRRRPGPKGPPGEDRP